MVALGSRCGNEHRSSRALWAKPNKVVSHIDAASLVAGLKRGDEGATQALVDHYYERILGYLFRMLQQRQSAEDVCQETFVRAMQRINQLSDPPALKAWLYRIATHLAYDYLRQRPQDASFDDAGEGLPAEMAHNPPLVERLFVADLLAQPGGEQRVDIGWRFYDERGV